MICRYRDHHRTKNELWMRMSRAKKISTDCQKELRTLNTWNALSLVSKKKQFIFSLVETSLEQM